MSNTIFVLGVFLTLALFVSADDIVLKPLPTKANLPPAGLVIIQGASISTDRYLSLAKEIQSASPFALFVGIPSYPLNAAIPVGPLFSGPVNRILGSLNSAGLPTTAKVFFAGHSLGGASVQDYVASNAAQVAGQILLGSALLRKHRPTYPVPTLTIGGELDGLMRITRVAENFYHQIMHSSLDSTAASRDFPVVIVEGMNHMQFASGQPPSFVASHDLKAEIDEDKAHATIASYIAAFIDVQLSGNNLALLTLQQGVATTGKLVAPVVDSFVLEGAYHFQAPCNSDTPSPHCPFYPVFPSQSHDRTPSADTTCNCGSRWTTEHAMPIMADLPEGWQMVSIDAFHDVSDVNPVHLPHLWNDCSSQSSSSCTLNVTTVTHNVYDTLDDFDTGFTHTSASELRVKMKCRQAIYRASFQSDAKLNDTDSSSICGAINQAAYQWALQNASPQALKRYSAYGVQMTFGDDIIVPSAGPLWIWDSLKYDTITSNGAKVLKVSAPAMKTDVDGTVFPGFPDPRGYHYCKLLSPARAMEWIYVDGLRQ